VFDVLHSFYLTRFGVYVLVFNMEDLLSADESKSRECIATLKYWLDTVVMHTMSEVVDDHSTVGGGGAPASTILRSAPVVLVGTRKDKVSNPEDHSRISTLLYDTFCDHLAFKFVLPNKNAVGKRDTVTMFFFPVNCLEGRRDKSTMDLMDVIEKEIESSDYVHQERPVNWLQTYDQMKASKKPYYTMDEVKAVSRSFGVDDLEVPYFLSFLHDMGMLMWHEEPSLCDVVIMDPVSFFVKPATNVICKHEPDLVDDTVHIRQIHDEMRIRYGVDFKTMTKKGIVTDRLMQGLLSECASNLPIVKNLMMKYGLMSQVLTPVEDNLDKATMFLHESSNSILKVEDSSSSRCSRRQSPPPAGPWRR